MSFFKFIANFFSASPAVTDTVSDKPSTNKADKTEKPKPQFSILAAETEIELLLHEIEDILKEASREEKEIEVSRTKIAAINKDIQNGLAKLADLRSEFEAGDAIAKEKAVKFSRAIERAKESVGLEESTVTATENLIKTLKQTAMDKEDHVAELRHRVAEYRHRKALLDKDSLRAKLTSTRRSSDGSLESSLEALEREQELQAMNLKADAMPEPKSLSDYDPFAVLGDTNDNTKNSG